LRARMGAASTCRTSLLGPVGALLSQGDHKPLIDKKHSLFYLDLSFHHINAIYGDKLTLSLSTPKILILMTDISLTVLLT
jgi:hypothetical protein